MKANTCVIKMLVLAAALAGAGSLLAANNPPTSGAPKTGTRKGGPATPETKKDGKTEPEPTIAGIVLNRPKGGFLGLTLDDHKFKLSFYDLKKKPTKVDVARAAARWPVRYSVYDERTVLNPNEDGMALTSPKYIRPPYSFKLYLTLVSEEKGAAVETYVIDFHQ